MKPKFLFLFLILALLSGCSRTETPPETAAPTTEATVTEPAVCTDHTDADDTGDCDVCGENVMVLVDFYTVNDLHGKIYDGEGHPGVDELTTYIAEARKTDDHVVLLSAGDMWQGGAESNLTGGALTTEWMNAIGFDAMTLGNHEFDWGTSYVESNAQLAEFPFLAINIYDRETDTPVDYCQGSVLLDRGEVQIGLIGAMGDCYSSIAPERVEDIYFKVGDELTALVTAEAEKLRRDGADLIVYILHDGYGQSETALTIRGTKLRDYYDISLSEGVVDLVFEGHTHQRYMMEDDRGVLHMQNRGENRGISHVEVAVNTAGGSPKMKNYALLAPSEYVFLEPDPILETLREKYSEEIAPATEILGQAHRIWRGDELRQQVAQLYYEKGVEKWGAEYDIVLGGGFISVRNPYDLPKGEVNYGILQTLFPFDNELVLCSVAGRDLKERFFESDHENYFIAYGSYGANLRWQIDPDATYYIIVDTYSSSYAPNNLTEVARWGEMYYARDMLAEWVKGGGLNG